MKLPATLHETSMTNTGLYEHGSLPGLTLLLAVLTGSPRLNHQKPHFQERSNFTEDVSFTEHHLLPSSSVGTEDVRRKRDAGSFEPYDASYSSTNSTKGFILRLRGDTPRFLSIVDGSVAVGRSDASHSSICMKKHIFTVVATNLPGETVVIQNSTNNEFMTGQTGGNIGVKVEANYDVNSISKTDSKFFRIFQNYERFYNVQNLHSKYYLSATDNGVTSVSQDDFDSSSQSVEFEMYDCVLPASA